MKLRLVILARPVLGVLSCAFLLCLGNFTGARAGSQESGEHELHEIESDQPKGGGKVTSDKATIEALQRQLQERDKIITTQSSQIEVMSNQLEDLKRIDEDSQGRQRLPPLSEGAP